MSKKEEDKTPEFISKHKKLYGHATKLLDTASHTHNLAYSAAVEKHLRDGETIDFERLDNSKVQEQFSKTMSDFYVGKAKQHFKMAKDLDELDKELLLQAYVGTTSHELKAQVARYGKRFTHEQFERVKGELQENLGQRLYGAAGGHLEEEHVKEIVKHMGLEGRVDVTKINLNEARALLGAFHREEGTISDTILRQVVPSYKILKKKKEEIKKAA